MLKDEIIQAYETCRRSTEQICQPLKCEDYGLQAAPFTSPVKWHLAHTSWFFETFLLKPYLQSYQSKEPAFEYLFNSYYNAVGEQYPRAQRGLLSRPTVEQVYSYRTSIDTAMFKLLAQLDCSDIDNIQRLCLLGIEHEKQHQELIFTDLKYCLYHNPMYPAYKELSDKKENKRKVASNEKSNAWFEFSPQLTSIGVDKSCSDFFFDNEGPIHNVQLGAYALAQQLVSNKEFQAFIDDGGYQRPELWLADGWALVQEHKWRAPLYWDIVDNASMEYTLHGLELIDPDAPVCHISGYEADAYANWVNARLPTEAEWEHAVKEKGVNSSHSNFFDESKKLHPVNIMHSVNSEQFFGECWQWTGTAYRPYPGFKPVSGAVGEYNGKFMSNQWVLRGSSCVTSYLHTRPSYRNFFYPQDRWQFSSLRLAKDI